MYIVYALIRGIVEVCARVGARVSPRGRDGDARRTTAYAYGTGVSDVRERERRSERKLRKGGGALRVSVTSHKCVVCGVQASAHRAPRGEDGGTSLSLQGRYMGRGARDTA